MHMYVVNAHTYMYSYLSMHKIMLKLICAQVHTVPACMYTCYFTEQSKHSLSLHLVQHDFSLPPQSCPHYLPVFPQTHHAAGTV